jgi:hypothetical protein
MTAALVCRATAVLILERRSNDWWTAADADFTFEKEDSTSGCVLKRRV